MFGFGKKKDEGQKADGADAQAATATKDQHEAEHVDDSGKPKAEKVGEVCEFC